MKKGKCSSKYDNVFSIGQKFGLWTVQDSTVYKTERGGGAYGTSAILVKCDCGTERLVVCANLLNGRSPNCGCERYKQKASKNYNWRGIGEIPGRQIHRIERGAEKRDIEYAITPQLMLDQLQLQNYSCALSGDVLTFGSAAKINGIKTETLANASLDRIDSTQGYVSGNIQWVTKNINLAKLDKSQEEFIEMCKKVAERHK